MKNEEQKNPVGRPTVMTSDIVNRLEEGFLLGFTDAECCLFAGIAPTTLYAFCQTNQEFAERKELLKEQIKMRAKQNIAAGINDGEKPLSQWYLERKDASFSTKSENKHIVGVFSMAELRKKMQNAKQ